MLPEEQEVVKITPLPESLLITHSKNHGLYSCTEDGCSFSTSNPSMLGLHKAQAHKIKTGPKKGVVHQYFCPHPGCYFNPESGRFLKNLDTLRTHYMKVHMEKSFKCSKCEKGFSLERDCLRHEKECGQIFACPDCEKVYKNKGALKMHCLYKGHKTPTELCPKPKTPAVKSVVDKKQQNSVKGQPQHPVPILPKILPQDNFSVIVPSTEATTSTALPATVTVLNQSSSSEVPPSVTVMIQNNNTNNNTNINNNMNNNNTDFVIPIKTTSQIHPQIVSIIHKPPGQKIFCDNVTQTIKFSPTQIKSKRHAPTQTRLSILERAMKSSKIPITKTSRATQKSMTATSRKRKIHEKVDSTSKKNKQSRKLTVATLTDPQRNPFSQNIGSQTIFSILYQNQLKNMAVNTSDTYFKTSMSTQTSTDNPLSHLNLSQMESQRDLDYYQMPHPSLGTSHSHSLATTQSSDSVTQTFNSLLTSTSSKLNSSETQTCLTQSSSSTTQTLECSALDTSTQTLDLNIDNSTNILEDLFPEHSGISVDTQTFGCFSSDMMTQTLEDLACDDSHEISTNTFSSVNDFVSNDTTTQTFEEMVDSITQTLNSNLPSSTTQTNFRTDITTQTLHTLGIDITTQTFDSATTSDIDCYTQTPRSLPRTFDNIYQTNFANFLENDAGNLSEDVQKDYSTQTQSVGTQSDHPVSKGAGNLSELFNLMKDNPTYAVSNQEDKTTDEVAIQTPCSTSTVSFWSQTTGTLPLDSQEQMTQTTVNNVREMALQTESVDLWELSEQTSISLSRNENGERIESSTVENVITSNEPCTNPVADSMTQTLSLPDHEINLEALLSDMATQTFEEDDFTFDALLQSSEDLSSNFASQASSQNLTNIACQTPVQFCSEIDNNYWKDSLSTCNEENGGENLWEIGTQTLDDVREMALQTDSEDLWETSAQSTQVNFTGISEDCSLLGSSFETGTQTAVFVDDFVAVGVQTFENDLWEMGTQTGGDNAWETGTQTGMEDLWETGTQTGHGENAWETGTQTGACNILEMGTQTGGDRSWETGTQTGIKDLLGTTTQTGGDNHNAWEMATQTGIDNILEMGTQTGLGNAWGMGTQRGIEDLWETGTQTQTGGDDLLEMSTQTWGGNAWETGTQTGGDDLLEMSTQTWGGNAWETGTQTGGDDLLEMSTQTWGDNAWETGTQTQTGGDDLLEMSTQTWGDNAWEMGTQTMDNLLTDTMTQTGDDLIDFLLTADN